MTLDPIPEEVRQHLSKNFTEVRDEPPQGDYYVFSLKTSSGQMRHLKVYRKFFIHSKVVSEYLKKPDLITGLHSGDVELAEPL